MLGSVHLNDWKSRLEQLPAVKILQVMVLAQYANRFLASAHLRDQEDYTTYKSIFSVLSIERDQ